MFSVCRKGYVDNGAGCVSCLRPIHGIGNGPLVDANTSTCLDPQQEGIYIQSSLLVYDGCRNEIDVNLNVTVNYQTQCKELLGMIFVEIPSMACLNVLRCQEINSVIKERHRICGIECQCPDSADQCLIHLINEINVEICEIIITA